MLAFLSHLTISITIVTAPAAVGPDAAPSTETIDSLITDLGSASFIKREEATQRLWEVGAPAEAALLSAEKSPDAEVRRRARIVLGRFRLGIYPDTPKNVVTLIRQFTSGDSTSKRRAFNELLESNELRTAIRLLRQDTHNELTHQLKGELAKQIQRLVATSGDLDDAASDLTEAVRLAAYDDDGRRRLAAYLLLTGGIDAEIRQLQAIGNDVGNDDLRQLFYLHRITGDRSAMLAVAAKIGDSDLIESALIELGRWGQLNETLKAAGDVLPDDFFAHLKSLGRRAVFAKYANDEEGCAAAIAELKELATSQPDEAWSCARAMLLCEDIVTAEELLKKNDEGSLIEIHRFQNRFDDLFATLGVDAPQSPPTSWMTMITKDATDEDRERHFFKGLTVVGLLDSVGHRDNAIKLLGELYESAKPNDALPTHEVIVEEFAMGLDEKAFTHVEELLEDNQPGSVLNLFFSSRASAAELLWLEQLKHPNPPTPRKTFERIYRILSNSPNTDDMAFVEMLVHDTIAQVDEQKPESPLPDEYREAISVLSGLALFVDKPAWAIELHEATDPWNTNNARAQLAIADLYADLEDWPAAAKRYRKAREADPTDAAATYFFGHALTKTGAPAEGERLMKLAEVLPLHDASTRAFLASAMEDRGHAEAAHRQWEFILNVGRPGGWELDQAAQSLAGSLGESNPARAAHLWRRLALRGVEPHTSFGAVRHYITLPAMVHRCQARAALAKAEYETAVKQINIVANLAPGDTTVALDFVPPLDAAGQTEAADQVFGRLYNYHDALCHSYPRSAMHLNNLAWMCAKCDRRLDEAFAKSNKAVNLDPKPAYLDTLAELHFMRGETEEAIALEKRCIELDPDEPIYREQLDRFQE